MQTVISSIMLSSSSFSSLMTKAAKIEYATIASIRETEVIRRLTGSLPFNKRIIAVVIDSHKEDVLNGCFFFFKDIFRPFLGRDISSLVVFRYWYFWYTERLPVVSTTANCTSLMSNIP